MYRYLVFSITPSITTRLE